MRENSFPERKISPWNIGIESLYLREGEEKDIKSEFAKLATALASPDFKMGDDFIKIEIRMNNREPRLVFENFKHDVGKVYYNRKSGHKKVTGIFESYGKKIADAVEEPVRAIAQKLPYVWCGFTYK
jgi:hypothetical protein